MLLITFILATYGLSYILSQSYLTQSIRDKYKKQNMFRYLINCIVCTGFYCSVALLFLYLYTNIFFLYPFAGVGAIKIISTLLPNNIF